MSKLNVPQKALDAYLAYIKEDYIKWWGPKASEKTVQGMIAAFKAEIQPGTSYIKIVTDRSVHSFIVNKPNGKFPVGTILKAAAFNAPAKNFVRAHLEKPETWKGHITWTGAH
jgi:hypothetical protein